MEFGTFIELTDSWKLFIVEINVADEIQDLTWVQHGVHTNLWYADYDVGCPNKVLEDGSEYTERFTLAEANSNAGSFYYDLKAQVLYVHTTGTDNPGKMTGDDYDYSVIPFCWRNFCNSQSDDGSVIYDRLQEALTDGGFEEWLTANNLTSWNEGTAGTSTVNRESGTGHVVEGGHCVRLDIDAGNSFAGVDQDIILVPKGKNRIRLRYKMSLAAKTAEVIITDSGSNVYLNSSGQWQAGATSIALANSTSWAELDLEFYAHKDYTNYNIMCKRTSAASSCIYFDNARLTRYREPNYYHPFFQSADLPSIYQAVADFYVGAVKMQFGRLRFLNDGYWYPTVQNHLWHNKDIAVRYGAEASDYEDLELIFSGRTKKPAVGDEFSELVVSDRKVLTYREIPATKYWTSNYPNLEDGAEGLPIPIIYGDVENIVPTCIDTPTYKFKIALHEINSIVAVYKNGALLTGGGVDYTADLANGEFTLTRNPGFALITCDVEGKKCSMLDGSYSTNIADILWDMLTTYGEIPEQFLDKEAFLDLRSGRTQAHHLYLDTPTSLLELVRTFQTSALFHLVPLGSGKLAAKRYVVGTDASTPRLEDEDFKKFKIRFETGGVYKHIKIRYDRNPGDSSYSTVVRTTDDVKWKYDEEDTLPLTTTLKIKGDAENLGDYYKALLRNPLQKAVANVPTEAFSLIPSDKVILSKTKMTDDGLQTVLDETAFRVMELKKNIKTGRVDIVSLEDLQSAGAPFCEVCNLCQVCVTTESGVCSVCYGCQLCDSGQCSSCQTCYYCEKCDSGQCTVCESCVACQKCNAGECGSCENCDTCQKCDSGECDACQVCDTCEKCDSGQCALCQTCDTCQKCDTGECSGCQICNTCEKCDSGECTACQTCDSCQKCDTCQNSECASCQACDTCQLCDTCQNSQCTICEDCNLCQTCDTCQNTQCTACEVCDSCQLCNTCESTQCTSCQICVGCEKCNTCQNAECDSCQSCDTCQKCDSGECTTCQLCNACQKCDSGECAACQICVACQLCDTGECAACQICVGCEKCDTCQNSQCSSCQTCDSCQKCDTCQNTQCSGCEICNDCQNCNTCQNTQCTACETCDSCQLCNTCQNSQCTACESCDNCELCNTCENTQCTACEICVACMKCNSGECTTCMSCNSCQKCNAGECADCQTCNVCQKCDSGECAACQLCVACEKCNTGECTACQTCDSCQKCDTCQNSQCTTCMICVGCESCDGCMTCDYCQGCDECMECYNCQNEPM